MLPLEGIKVLDLSSVVFGLIWTRISPEGAFLAGAVLAVAATLLLYFLFPNETNSRDKR